jgi:restriction endonuclease Mrr
MLVGLMINHDVGVTPESRYEVKKLDADSFER